MAESKSVYWADKFEIDSHNEYATETMTKAQQAYEMVKIALETLKSKPAYKEDASVEAVGRVLSAALELMDDIPCAIAEGMMIFPKTECEGYRTLTVEECAAREMAMMTVDEWLKYPNAARMDLEELEKMAADARKGKEQAANTEQATTDRES